MDRSAESAYHQHQRTIGLWQQGVAVAARRRGRGCSTSSIRRTAWRWAWAPGSAPLPGGLPAFRRRGARGDLPERGCAACRGRSPLRCVRSVGPHVAPLRDAVHALKYEGAGLATPLAALMATARRRSCGGGPRAAAPAARRQRGYNQAALLARAGLPTRSGGRERNALAGRAHAPSAGPTWTVPFASPARWPGSACSWWTTCYQRGHTPRRRRPVRRGQGVSRDPHRAQVGA